jgi:hypothetical protein
MRAAGMTYDQIWSAMPGEYRSRSALIQDAQRALLQVVAEPAADLKALEAARLDMLWVKAMQVLSRSHVVVSHGRVVYMREPKINGDGTKDVGEPLQDSGPVLAAIRELRFLSESRRKLFGLDAATVVQVISDDALDAEIKKLSAELDAAEAAKATDIEGAETPEG